MSFVELSAISNTSLMHSSQIIDTARREELSRSPWHSKATLYCERERVNKEFLQSVKNIFQQKIGVQNQRAFEKLWEQALDVHRITWNPSQPLTVDTFQKIEKALRETFVYHGKGIEAEATQGRAEPHVREIVQFLLGRREMSKEWLNLKLIKAVLIRKDPQFLLELQDELRQILKDCGQRYPSESEEVVFQAFVGNVVSLIPFCYPEEGCEFSIPQKINGVWQNLTYKVDRKLELTPSWFSTPMVAYGLTSEEGGDPILSFIGTTYPSGDGYVATVLADFTPFMSVGRVPYLLGKRAIEGWLEDKQDVQVYGASLGGAMAFHALKNHTSKISRVEAYNPPGFYYWDWDREYNENGLKVNIYYQENDSVPTMGRFPEGRQVSVYRVLPEVPEGYRNAHIRAYTGSKMVTLLKSDPAFENKRLARKIMTLIHITLGMFFFFFPYLIIYLLSRPFVLAFQLCQRQAASRQIINN